MALKDQIVPAAFNGVEFPCAEVSSTRANESKAHKAWRVPGADIEHTGRGELKIKMRAVFLNGITGAWPADLYPGMHDRLESELLERPTGRLTHPRFGTIDAHFDSWSETIDPATQQGVFVELEFTESNASAFYPIAQADQEPASQMTEAAAAADTAVAAVTDKLPALSPVVSAQLDYLQSDTLAAGEAYGALAEVQTAAQTQLDSAYLAGAEAHDAREQVRAVLAASYAYAERYLTPKPQSRTYVVPTRMSLARAASLIYGDPTKSTALRRANTLPDELFLPTGFVLVVPDDA